MPFSPGCESTTSFESLFNWMTLCDCFGALCSDAFRAATVMERFLLREHRRIVDIWNNNKLGGPHPINRFTDRKTAVSRIWKAVQDLEAMVGKAAGTAASERWARRGRPRLNSLAPVGRFSGVHAWPVLG